MSHCHAQNKKAKKLENGDKVLIMGTFCRVTKVHTHEETTTINVRTYTRTNVDQILIGKAHLVIGKNVKTQFIPKHAKN